jgi:hypothetical protein
MKNKDIEQDYYVYILYRENGEPFYVGKGKGRRWLEHEAKAKQGKSYKDNVICQMLEKGIEVPKKKVAENLTNEQAVAIEIKLISEIGRKPNGSLTNKTDGGEGTPGRRRATPLPDEVRKRIAQKLIGRKNGPPSEQARRNIREALKGRKPININTPEALKKKSESLKAAWAALTPEERENRRGMHGKTHSEETKAKMRAAATGRRMSAESCRKMSESRQGRTIPLETRIKMSEAQKHRYNQRRAATSG